MQLHCFAVTFLSFQLSFQSRLREILQNFVSCSLFKITTFRLLSRLHNPMKCHKEHETKFWREVFHVLHFCIYYTIKTINMKRTWLFIFDLEICNLSLALEICPGELLSACMPLTWKYAFIFEIFKHNLNFFLLVFLLAH